MNILVLEDRGATFTPIVNYLDIKGHTVLDAYDPNEAQNHWNRRDNTPIHCIILDLNVPMDGLTEEQKADANDGFLAGWVWLRDVVLNDEPEMRSRIIIYTDYINILIDNVQDETELDGILLCAKRSRSSVDSIISKILEISNIIVRMGNCD